MKATLVKSEDSYILKDGLNHVLGIDDKKLKDRLECPYLLSKQNCDEIFGVVDVDKLAKQFTIDESYGEISGDLFKGYIYGFNKAMELNKDKVFTLKQMRKAFELGHDGAADTYMLEKKMQEFEVLIQQPTEIDVEIEMENKEYILTQNGEGFEDQSYRTWETTPKLDSSGCLILKKL